MGNRKRGKIKSRKPSKPAGIRSQEPTQYNQACIKFSFEYTLEDGRGGFNNLNQMQKAHIVSAMVKRRKQKWSDLISADKHALGLEKIAKDAIKTSMKELPRDLQDSLQLEHILLTFLSLQARRAPVGYQKQSPLLAQ